MNWPGRGRSLGGKVKPSDSTASEISCLLSSVRQSFIIFGEVNSGIVNDPLPMPVSVVAHPRSGIFSTGAEPLNPAQGFRGVGVMPI